MRMQQVKRQIKRMYTWKDELSPTTLVELIVGDKKVTNEETVEELGLCEASKVTVVFRKNVVQCSNRRGYGPDLDPEALVIVEIPDSEAAIKARAFEGCSRLAKVIIPSSVIGIGQGAFFGCSSLTEVTLPDSITHIGANAFTGCPLTQLIIPDSITEIGDEAFFNCSDLVSVNIPDSIRRIGERAFAGSCSLTSVDIPDSVTTIGTWAFGRCTRLTLTAPARLLDTQGDKNIYKLMAKECGCGRCDWRRFLQGWVCPACHNGS